VAVSEEAKYKAFISYSHQDERFASWLHHALETYRIPKHLISDNSVSALSPIFRDQDELPACAVRDPNQAATGN
jgi:hypothetical protein